MTTITKMTLALAAMLVLAAVACDTRQQVKLEWPTPAQPVTEYEAIIRSAGPAGIQPEPSAAALQTYYRARDEFLNAWRRENWELAERNPAEYAATMERIEAEWDARYRAYWQKRTAAEGK